MNIFDHLQMTDGACRLHPTGEMSLVDAVELVTLTIEHCRLRRIRKLLVNLTDLSGFSTPTLIDRFLMIEDWAEAAEGKVVVAVVTRPELIHPQRFGVQVAQDSGMRSDVFASEADAVAWLAAQE
jgi:hypothetical protein